MTDVVIPFVPLAVQLVVRYGLPVYMVIVPDVPTVHKAGTSFPLSVPRHGTLALLVA